MSKKPKLNKREILFRLLEVPDKARRPFFAREMKMLNDLIRHYSQDFMASLTFAKKFDSLAYLTSSKLKSTMDEKFRAFNFKVDFSRYPQYNIGKKSGKDVKIKTIKKTVKDFLDE